MHDGELVTAVAAGDPDGIAAAYDQFGVPLYTYCHLMLPDIDEAGEAVRDTFLIATARLGELRDPGRLRSWLYAVARNECLRRRSAAGVTSRLPDIPRAANGYAIPAEFELPAGLRGQVLKACTDNTPAGRADRASAAHRAGSFGPAGFPRTIGSPGPQWWRRVRQLPRAAAAATALAAVSVAAGIIAILVFGGSHHAQASTLAAAGAPGASAAAAASAAGAPSAPGHRTAPGSGRPQPPATAPGGSTPTADAAVVPSTRPASPPASASPAASSSSSSPSPSPSQSPSASPSPSPSQLPGTLVVAPDKLVLTAVGGKAATGTFILSAAGGPVSHYTITVPAAMAAKVKVSPATGSLVGGGYVTVTVTVTSKVAVDTQLIVNPGKIAVTVLLSIKA